VASAGDNVELHLVRYAVNEETIPGINGVIVAQGGYGVDGLINLR